MTIATHLASGYRGLLLAAALLPGVALATPYITSADVTLLDPVYGNVGPDTVAAGSSIQPEDSSQIGSTVLLEGEYIDVNSTSFIYNVLGGVLPCPITGYSCTGYGSGAVYSFSDIQFSSPGAYIENVSVALTNATYADGVGYSFGPDSVTMDVGSGELGLVSNDNGQQDFGTVELDITVGQGGAVPVPLPAPLALLCGGLGLLGWWRLRAQRSAPIQ